MYNNIKTFTLIFAAILIGFISCQKEKFSLGDLTTPADLVITADIVGKTTALPNGDGSGNVNFTFLAKDAISYKVDFGDGSAAMVYPAITTKTFKKVGTNHYRVVVNALGKGGITTTAVMEIDVSYAYIIDPAIVTNLTGGTSKTWVVDKSVAGQFGLGPWDPTVVWPSWWSAAINEKVACCNCFYTASFTFTKTPTGYTLTVATPDGAFTQTGPLAGGLPGIPASGAEACYSYGGGTGAFSFGPSSSGIAASAPSTKIAILLSGTNTFIGYGALLKEYEIMVLTSTYMYLRVQGTVTGNAWYLKLKAP